MIIQKTDLSKFKDDPNIMNETTIRDYIEIYLSHNKTEEMISIPFTKIFGNAVSESNYKEIQKIIQEKIPNIIIGDKKYIIGAWNIDNGLFYIKTQISPDK